MNRNNRVFSFYISTRSQVLTLKTKDRSMNTWEGVTATLCFSIPRGAIHHVSLYLCISGDSLPSKLLLSNPTLSCACSLRKQRAAMDVCTRFEAKMPSRQVSLWKTMRRQMDLGVCGCGFGGKCSWVVCVLVGFTCEA